MQGLTRDTAMAQKLWVPKQEPKPEPEIPQRPEPGVIVSERSHTRERSEGTSHNEEDTVLR